MTPSTPRTVLVLGGNGWLGRLVATIAVAQGDHVTCLARGQRGASPDGVEMVLADRTDHHGYDAVVDREWDAVVDVTWQPGLARSAVHALADRTRHWTYISSGAVYSDHSGAVGDALVDPLPSDQDTADDALYGPAKVACEVAVRDALGDRAAILRSGLLVGPGDVSDRFGYWVARMAVDPDRPVLGPPRDGRPVQYLDARDLAQWIVDLPGHGIVGTIDAVGDSAGVDEILAASARVAGHRGGVVRPDRAALERQSVAPWFGPRSLPLWAPHDFDPGYAIGDPALARAAGLHPRSLAATLRDTLDDERRRGLDRPRRAGLTRSEEDTVLAALTPTTRVAR